VIDLVGRETGVIFGEVDDGVLAGDVGGSDDGVVGPGYVRSEVDGYDAPTGYRRADGGAVPQAGEDEVVDVLRGAQDFGAAFLAEGRGAENGRALGHRPRARGVWGIR
jgi:hypothetical protein